MTPQRELGELTGSVGLLTKLAFAIIALLAVIVGGGFAMYKEIGEMRTDSALVKRDVADVVDRLKKVEILGAAARTAQDAVQASLSRIEGRLGALQNNTTGSDFLTNSERILVSSALADRVKTWKVFALAPYKIGDAIAAAETEPLPDFLQVKVPKLEGAAFTVDSKYNILLLSGKSGRLLAVVPPS